MHNIVVVWGFLGPIHCHMELSIKMSIGTRFLHFPYISATLMCTEYPRWRLCWIDLTNESNTYHQVTTTNCYMRDFTRYSDWSNVIAKLYRTHLFLLNYGVKIVTFGECLGRHSYNCTLPAEMHTDKIAPDSSTFTCQHTLLCIMVIMMIWTE